MPFNVGQVDLVGLVLATKNKDFAKAESIAKEIATGAPADVAGALAGIAAGISTSELGPVAAVAIGATAGSLTKQIWIDSAEFLISALYDGVSPFARASPV